MYFLKIALFYKNSLKVQILITNQVLSQDIIPMKNRGVKYDE